jgi:capsule polysaccharide export protein KpsE/RkpR
MTNKELYNSLNISKKCFYNYIKLGMPKDIELATEWIKERSALTDQGSGQITIGGRIYTKDNLIDLKGKILDLSAKEKQAKIDLAEFELKKKRGILVEKSELIITLKSILEPLSKMLEQLPSKVSTIANPDNPEVAYKALENEVQNIFKEIQKHKEK